MLELSLSEPLTIQSNLLEKKKKKKAKNVCIPQFIAKSSWGAMTEIIITFFSYYFRLEIIENTKNEEFSSRSDKNFRIRGLARKLLFSWP